MARSIRSFAFFLLAVLAVTNAVSIEHGRVSQISRQTSGHMLSFVADLGLETPSNYDVYYSVGLAAGQKEVLDWTPIASPVTVNRVDHTLTSVTIPDNYNITINLLLVDKAGLLANQTYSSHELKVGDRLTSDATCAGIFNPVGTSTITPPQPDITIEYDNVGQKFHFNIVAQYLLQGYTWVIDFAPFSRNANKGTHGLAATNCENRQTADLTGRDFAAFWNAAPAADYAGALNSENFLAYRLGDASSADWTVSANGCDKVNYTTPGFSFQDLLNCKNSDGGNSIIRSIVDNTIQYNGTLYITAVKAVNPLDASAGFLTTEFTVPFFVSFSVSSTSISSGTDSNIFAFTITSLNIAADGNLALTMNTNTFIASSSLSAPNVATHPGSVALTGTTNTPGVVQQTWTFTTTTPTSDYSGAYVIEFLRSDGAKRATVTVAAQFTLNLAVNSGYGNSNNLLPTSLAFFGSESFIGEPKTAYTSLDTIFVKSTVDVVAGRDNNTYANSIYNVWLCYTIDDVMPVYVANTQQLGCTAQTWSVRPITRLVMNGELTLGALENQFSAMINNTIPGLDAINSGFRFQAAPLATLKSGKFFIQIESRIKLPSTNKRTVFADEATGNKIQPFSVSANGVVTPVEPEKTPIASSANIVQYAAAAAIFGGALLF
eukprot:TRINITY_DN2983_c0_g1_i1.p1 TRINITY_DN2983_c0_g1~~TRINITY_DN2983_c0_g1_i1.p1  ORF type:complete len:661 (-),score=182.70 TRINITY_DN2983_c0_g1_i1:85-2067(-)